MFLSPFVVLCLFIVIFPKAIPSLFKDGVGLIGGLFNLFVKSLNLFDKCYDSITNSSAMSLFRKTLGVIACGFVALGVVTCTLLVLGV
jgi:uncharacterized membrane protein